MTAAERIAELFRTQRQYLGQSDPGSLDKALDFESELADLICELLGRHDPIAINDREQRYDHCSRCERLTRDLGLERDPERPGKYRPVEKETE